MVPDHPRLLIVGIDGATWRLMRPWIADGHLPTLGRLVEQGVSGDLLSVPNMHSPAAWTSFMTGTNPGKHGVFFFTERIPGTYGRRQVTGGHRKGRTLWRYLSDAGPRVGVVNVPMTYPAEPVNGFMISGLDAPGPSSPGFTYPEGLSEEIERALGRNVLHTGLISGAIGSDIVRGRYALAGAKLVERVWHRTSVCEYLLRTRPTDVFTVVYTETDGAQHFFWHFVDPTHPDYHPESAARHGHVIRDVYRAIDQSVERLIAQFSPDAVLVVSDHGFGPAFASQANQHFLLLLLEALGFAEPRTDSLISTRRQRPNLVRSAARGLTLLSPWILPRNARIAIKRRFPALARTIRSNADYRLNWSSTKTFTAGTPGEIFLNVRGREPQGCVDPGRDYDTLREEIIERLRRCVDSDGRPIVAGVDKREDLYHGPYMERAGDLYVRFVDSAIQGVEVDGEFLSAHPRGFGRREVRSGFHRPEGVLILAGKGVRSNKHLTGLHLYDVAPTVLYYMGQPIGAHMDGKVTLEAFEPTITATRIVTVVDGEASEAQDAGQVAPERELTAGEIATLEERLRNLGYM